MGIRLLSILKRVRTKPNRKLFSTVEKSTVTSLKHRTDSLTNLICLDLLLHCSAAHISDVTRQNRLSRVCTLCQLQGQKAQTHIRDKAMTSVGKKIAFCFPDVLLFCHKQIISRNVRVRF